MSRNGFRLRPLARLRESQRDALRARLGEAVRASAKLDADRVQLVAEIDAVVAARCAITESATPDVAALLASQRYESALAGRLASLDDDRRKVAEEIERRRAGLVEGERSLGVVRKLEERHDARELAEQRRRDVAEMDEVAARTRAFGRVEGSSY